MATDRRNEDCLDFGDVKRTRSTNLAQLTKLYKELEKNLISYENVEHAKQLYSKLCERFEQFKLAHLQCLDLCTQSEVIANLEVNYERCHENFVEFRDRFSQYIASEKSHEEEIPEESDTVSIDSSLSSRSSVSSQSRFRSAKAKRLIAELKLRKLSEQHELERAQIEIKFRQQVFNQLSEMEEANIEESVWQEAVEEDTDNNSGIMNIRNISQTVSQTLQSSVPESEKECINTNSLSGQTAATDKPKMNINNSTQGISAQSGFSDVSVSSIDSAFQRLASTLHEGFNLPKPELLTFNGTPLDYSKFIRNFETNIEGRISDNSLRLSYLIQYCRGEAKCCIEDCVLLDSDEGYKRARAILYSRYGRPHVIARSFIEKLVYGAQIKASDIEGLSKLALEMQKCEITLSQLGFNSDIDNSENLRCIVKRFPMHMRTRWVDIAHSISESGREPRFSDLAKFVDEKSRIASSMYGYDLCRENNQNKTDKRVFTSNHHNNDTVNSKVTTLSTQSLNNTAKYEHKCKCCTGTCVDLTACSKFKSMSLDDRIIPVLVKGRNGNSCKTFALLDDGADKTLCDERLLQKLNIASKPVTFEMSTVSSSGSTIHGQEVDLQVKAIDGNDNVSLKKVWSVKKLPISARSAAENVDIRKLPYLADIQIPSTDLTEVMLLIGTDSPNAHIPLEVRSGNENQPYAIRSRLGWAIRGPIEDTHASNVINVHFEEARDVLLQRQLERMWTSDFDDRAREDKNGLSIEDKEAMKMMESSITQEDGHFKLGLPWRDRETTLPNNMVLAHARLQQLKRKLSSNETLHKMYTTTVNDYIEKGYAKEVTNIESKSKRVWYLPHHPITNENKPGKVHLQSMMKMGGFRLTKWLSNRRNVLNAIPESERASSVVSLGPSDMLPSDKALGVIWDVNEDKIKFKVKLSDKPLTRRGILSIVSSIFDPLGLVSPVTLRAKAIVQHLCKEKFGWDEQIPQECHDKWKSWVKNLPCLENLSVNRCFLPRDVQHVKNVQLHIFSDGSELGYGACAYLRVVDENDRTTCSLVMGKARLAPIKQVSIPRLELSGAVTACRLYEILSDELELKINTVTFWTDSTIVLGYIRNTSRRFKTFVANRLSVIQNTTSLDQWRHVDSKQNPADIASRGIDACDRKNLDIWLNGPKFLHKNSEHWPRNVLDEELGISETDTEIKKEIAVHATTTNAIDNLLGYFSDWIKLRRAIAWFRRFKIYCRNRYLGHHLPCNSGNLNVTELREATDEILAHVQMSYFSDEITNLKKAKPVKKGSRIASLNPVLVNELIRSKGRLNYDLSTCPVILPNKHHVTTLIIRYYHETTGHVGKQQVLAASREKYWILKGSSAVKTVIDRCVPCKRQHGPFCKQQMAPLLEEQMTADKPPFTFVGVDYFGPLNVKLGRSVVKRYGCLFTCLTTRAVHIEIAHSLNTDSFISAFQRFTSRRGIPEKVYSDNGTNFVGGEIELRKNIEQWNKATISNYMLHKDIIWTFNPPYASHRGGAWERMIRSTRNIFKALINQQLLSDEQLLTFMAETERIMNDRPITAISDDCRDLPVLTPNMLLLMKSNTSTPQGVFDKKDIYAKRWWKQIQHLANEFWKRWLREYLPTLQQRRKWQREERDVEIDDIVLVADERIQRGQWPLGRIVEVTRSRDGHIRSCVVKTSQSHILRPINKLCLLECSK
ncbi:unnamed protein product [Mytilus edulis]|uniref:Integrase catalytic domain-containing protein n=1 Tax=Mytilus edulis TaxID=6550 RepID=A0A8S3VPW8_MYTED|nr:unnamed protein product [Mytilus edulis]